METRFDQSQDFDVGFGSDTQETVTIESSSDLSADFGDAVEIEVGFTWVEAFSCGFNSNDEFEVGFEREISEDEYQGTYEVTPTSSEQYLQTANKKLTQNVTVHATPYAEVSNPEGGYTATIL